MGGGVDRGKKRDGKTERRRETERRRGAGEREGKDPGREREREIPTPLTN